VLQGVDVLAHCLRLANAHVSPWFASACLLICGQALVLSP
jgi:hypothetical protein